MKKKMNSEILENYYLNAIKSYKRCIEKSENSFLSDEIDISVFDLQIEKDSVKFKYSAINSDSYLIEVRLNLLSNEINLGYYVSVLDEKYNEVDNYLVFS
ncbi:hypothetical protein MP477_08485 [Chryseobacterium sp. WG23]|uniref:hypothetical protein n=1 Tax=Chryseobacterium sp. WG23 TaxID=2926910 RepID=UPI00211F01A0|nr:hypothetical protein [Chryseobacterium sp. WG23]MCQ9634986.1 hypothetical protein [Chryseobacterium sp. WG23]